MNTWVFGDIHGELVKLKAALKQIEEIEAGSAYKIVTLGDYIDRGPDSKGVISLLMALQKARGVENVTCLRGNHETFMLETCENDDSMLANCWMANGGRETLLSYGGFSIERIDPDHLAWVQHLPIQHEDKHRYYVHAGMMPGLGYGEQREKDLIWIREDFLRSDYKWPKVVVHGHTVTRSRQAEVRTNRVCLDTGACFNGPLTVAQFNDNDPFPVNILQVKHG